MELTVKFKSSDALRKELFAQGKDTSCEQEVILFVNKEDEAFKQASIGCDGKLILDLTQTNSTFKVFKYEELGTFEKKYYKYCSTFNEVTSYIKEIATGIGYKVKKNYHPQEISFIPDSIEKLNMIIAPTLTKEQEEHNNKELKEGVKKAEKAYNAFIAKYEDCFATEEEAKEALRAEKAKIKAKKEAKEAKKEAIKKEQDAFIEKHGSELLKARVSNGYEFSDILVKEIAHYIINTKLGFPSPTDTSNWFKGEDGEVHQTPSLKAMKAEVNTKSELEKLLNLEFKNMNNNSYCWLSVLDAGDNQDTYLHNGLEFEISLFVVDDDTITDMKEFYFIEEEGL